MRGRGFRDSPKFPLGDFGQGRERDVPFARDCPFASGSRRSVQPQNLKAPLARVCPGSHWAIRLELFPLGRLLGCGAALRFEPQSAFLLRGAFLQEWIGFEYLGKLLLDFVARPLCLSISVFPHSSHRTVTRLPREGKTQVLVNSPPLSKT